MSEETSSAPGRRRKRSSSPRSNQVLVRLSDEEYERVAAGAAATNLTVPAYLARRGQEEIAPVQSGQRVTEAQMRALVSELYALKRILGLAGNNLNQIARMANSTGEVADETVHYAALIARTLERLEQFVSGLRRWIEP